MILLTVAHALPFIFLFWWWSRYFGLLDITPAASRRRGLSRSGECEDRPPRQIICSARHQAAMNTSSICGHYRREW
jgi:hypothetical protein